MCCSQIVGINQSTVFYNQKLIFSYGHKLRYPWFFKYKVNILLIWKKTAFYACSQYVVSAIQRVPNKQLKIHELIF